MQQLLSEILDEVRPLIGHDKVADYIPMPAGIRPNQLGITVCSRDGKLFHAGDALRPLSIQSISKVFSLVQTIQHSGEDTWQRLGHEPSGQPSNSLVQLELEHSKSRNPFINVGVPVICDTSQSCFTVSAQSMRDFVRRPRGSPEVASDSVVARSECQHRSRSTAVAYLMKSFGNFYNGVEAVLFSYFHYCALHMSRVDLARALCFLADKSFYEHSGKQVLNERQTRQVNTTMTAGRFHDETGNFAYQVGLPGKSDVGGGTTAVAPGHFTVRVQSSELSTTGNSLADIAMLEKLNERIGWLIF